MSQAPDSDCELVSFTPSETAGSVTLCDVADMLQREMAFSEAVRVIKEEPKSDDQILEHVMSSLRGTPAVPGGLAVYERQWAPVTGFLLDDDEPDPARLQLYGNRRQFNDHELRDPRIWHKIVGVRRGVYPRHNPFLTMVYGDYIMLKGASVMRSCTYHHFGGRRWGSVTPAAVTVWRIIHPKHEQ